MSDIVETTEAAVAENATPEEASPVTEAIHQEAEPQVEAAAAPEAAVEDSKFVDSLNSELKTHKALQDFKDVDGLAKSYLHLNSLIGKKIGDLTPEEMGDVYNKLGRPEAAKDYSMPDKMHEGMQGWYKDSAHKLGLTQDQARNLAESYMELEQSKMAEQQTAVENQLEEWSSDLKKEFGGSFDKRIETAKKAIEAFGGSELKEAMNATGMGSHPAMVKAFAQIGKEMLEGGLTATDASASFGVTPAEAKQKKANLMRDPEFVKSYMNNSHPSHKQAVEEIQSLYSIMSQSK